MKLSRTVAYALQATMQLAQSGSKVPVPCSQIAAQGEMPERFLLQVLRSLVTHGVLQSTRGVDGGYMLIRAAEEITLLDVIEAIDGPVNAHLPLQGTIDPAFQENLKQAMHLVNDTTRRQLAAISIASLIQPSETASTVPVAAIQPSQVEALESRDEQQTSVSAGVGAELSSVANAPHVG